MPLSEIARKSPFLYLLIFYMAGIASAEFPNLPPGCHNMPLVIIFLIALLPLIMFLVAIGRKPGYHTGSISAILAYTVIFGAGYCNAAIQQITVQKHLQIDGKLHTAFVEIVDAPVVSKKSVRYVADVWVYDQNKNPIKETRVILYFQKDSATLKLMPGDRLTVDAPVKPVSSPSNPGEFNYKRYLSARNIYGQIYLKPGAWHYIERSNGKSLQFIAIELRMKLLEKYRQLDMKTTYYGLLSAITLGYKNDIESHTKLIFSRAGVMHIMALSGFNVAVIAFMINYMLFFMNRNPLLKLFKNAITILLIWAFVLLTGLSPSVTRATVMVTLVIFGGVLQRRINTMNILYVSAFAMLTVSPSMITDVSFQLSFAAVFGILFFQPMIYHWIHFKNRILDKVWQLFTVSCAAQLATLPFTMYYFNQFPVYFWLTNLYVVPLVSVIICVAMAYIILGFIAPLSFIVGKVLEILVALLYKSVSFVETLPYSVLEHIRISAFQSALWGILILFSGMLILKRKVIYVYASLGLLMILQLSSMIDQLQLRQQQFIMVGHIKGVSVLSFISGKNGITLLDSGVSLDDSRVEYALHKFWIHHAVASKMQTFDDRDFSKQNLLYHFSDKKILILQHTMRNEWLTATAGKADILIITGNMHPDAQMIRNLNPKVVVFDSSLNYRNENQWKNLLLKEGIKYWSVNENGAYICNLKPFKSQQRQFPDGQ